MFIKLAILSLFYVFTLPAFAAVQTISCANCTTFQMERAAISTSSHRPGAQYVIVMDYANEIAQKYSVFYSMSDRGEPSINTYPLNLSSDELHDVDIIFEYRREMVQMLKQAELLPDFLANSAQLQPPPKKETNNVNVNNYYTVGTVKIRANPFDFVRTQQIQNDLFDYYKQDFKGKFAEIISGVLNKVEIPNMREADLKLEITFIELDEEYTEQIIGRAMVGLDFDLEKFDFLVIRDVENASIPLNSDAAQGDYRYTNTGNRDAMMTYITDSFTGGGGGSDCRVTKVQVIDGRYVFTFKC